MWIVVEQLKIFVLEVKKIFDLRVDAHSGLRAEVSGKLQLRLFDMVAVQMRIAKRVDEIAGLKPTNLCHHHGE